MSRECLICNAVYYKKATCSKKEWSNSKTCSATCRVEYVKQIRKGIQPKNVVAGWNKGIAAHWIMDDKSPNWKGDSVGYIALHDWVRVRMGRPCHCENCGLADENKPRRFHWANISGNYLRDLSDWVRLCVSCHKLYDNGKIQLNLTELT